MSATGFTKFTKDVFLFGQLPSAIEQLLCKGSDPHSEYASSQDSLISSQLEQESQSALVNIPFPLAVDDVSHYHRNQAENVFSASKNSPLKRIIHVSRLGAHRPDKTGPILGCYEMERQLNWLRDPSLLHLRCGFFPDEVIDHLFLVPENGSIVSLLSPTTPVPVADPGKISQYIFSALEIPAKTGKFIEQPEPAVFFTIEKMLKCLVDSKGEQVNYRQLSPREAIQFYTQKGYGRGAAQCWCELFQELNMDHRLLYDASGISRQSASFDELFGKILSQKWGKS